MTKYHYIGPSGLRDSVSERRLIQKPSDVRDWVSQTQQRPQHGMIVATFIINVDGQLWIADRHSEHVACAAGQPVLSAGEMTFSTDGSEVSVVEVSNQSLGYCPEPSSWPAVAAALDNSALPRPPDFTNAYVIRRCEVCQAKNIVKDGLYECGVCGEPLPLEWNF